MLGVGEIAPVKGTGENDKPVFSNISRLISVFKANSVYSNLWGYFLLDEPKYDSWAVPVNEMPNGTQNLTLEYNTYRQYSGGKRGLFNLQTSNREDNVGPKNDNEIDPNRAQYSRYIAYLKKIYEKFHPQMLSVDIYPIASTSEAADAIVEVKDQWYWTLEAMADCSREKNVPFWLFMLSNQHTTYNEKPKDDGSYVGYAYPYPTVGILRFQAMTALAYGIQGLVFWTYGVPANKYYASGLIRERYYDAPFKDGKTTPIWNNCRIVISEIKKYGKVLLNAKFQGARHVYKSNTVKEKMFSETTVLSGTFGCIANAYATGKGFVITHLVKGSQNYMAIVSHDFANKQDVAIAFDDSCKWMEVQFITSAGSSESRVSQKNKVTGLPGIQEYHYWSLEPGGMVLISFQKIQPK